MEPPGRCGVVGTGTGGRVADCEHADTDTGRRDYEIERTASDCRPKSPLAGASDKRIFFLLRTRPRARAIAIAIGVRA